MRRNIIIIGAFLAAAALVILAVAGFLHLTPASTPQTTASAPATPIDTPPTEGSYDDYTNPPRKLRTIAAAGALAAARWNSDDSPAARVQQYRRAHFSAQLADTYTPVWAAIFHSESVSKVNITAKDAQDAGIQSVTGTKGHRTYTVGVTITYNGTWTDHGDTKTQPDATATWTLTIDEATNTITAITQPTPDDVQIRI